jgi:hypothetical protein
VLESGEVGVGVAAEAQLGAAGVVAVVELAAGNPRRNVRRRPGSPADGAVLARIAHDRTPIRLEEEDMVLVGRALAALVLVLVTAVAGVVSADESPGASSAAHACQKGGYRDVTRADGTRFGNVGQCVSFAARGGTLTPIPRPSLALRFIDASPGLAFELTATGFAPRSPISLWITRAGATVDSVSRATDDQGGWRLTRLLAGYAQGNCSATPYTFTVTDAAGNTATTIYQPPC